MESESGASNTKISESGYSNSFSNSQRSGSSKSRNSGSNSSRSSGYCGVPNGQQSVENDSTKRNKDHKKKKQKVVPQTFTTPINVPVVDDITGQVEPPVPDIGATELPPTAPEPIELESEPARVEPQNDEKQSVERIEHDEEVRACTEKDEEVDYIVESDPTVTSQPDDGFCCVISMNDGLVLYTTPSLTSVLGFPKDSWLGRSFIDFVHPKDRETFASHVTTKLTIPILDSEGKTKDFKNYLYVGLRKYRGVKSPDFCLVEKQVSYQAFHLTITVKQISDSGTSDNNNDLLLVVVAAPVYSAYKVPAEGKRSTKFGMRHTATSIFNHVDPDVVTNFGFLPQDMLGKSVFDFYHPEDMPFLKEIYKSVMKSCQINGSVFRSRPYRFLVQNGCFAMIETEWSSVINPWSRRLEFVISLHKVLQGPLNPNVFDTPSNEEYKRIPEDVIKQGKLLQAEIVDILNQELPRSNEIIKQEVNMRCQDLASFMESLMNEVNSSKMEIELPQDLDPTISERDSVMLGEISPHHDYFDSKSSSETPPSYNQLNYNENINRFFQSNPKTTVSDESNSQVNVMVTDAKNLSDCVNNTQKCLSPVENSRASRSGSAGDLSSGSNPNLESGTTSGTNTSNGSYLPPQLTESILVKHNEDMEKIMIQRHREERSHNKDRETKKSHQKLEKYANRVLKDDTNEHSHGVKRSGSHSWDGDCYKMLKHQQHDGVEVDAHEDNRREQAQHTVENTFSTDVRRMSQPMPSVVPEVNLWPSFPLTTPNTSPGLSGGTPVTAGMMPVYYVPAPYQARPNYNESLPRYQVQYMPAGVFYNYNTIFPPPSVLCPTVPVFSIPVNAAPTARPANVASPRVPQETPSYVGDSQRFGARTSQSTACHRPSSQATSVKAEPGSRMGSIASASVANKAMSECSRKDLMGLRSVCSPDTPLVSPPDGETQTEHYNFESKKQEANAKPPDFNYRRNNTVDEESSCYSSSYSSFLKTDTGSGSNDDSASQNKRSQRSDDGIRKHQRKVYPMRKKDPPWVESVAMSPDLVYRYQVTVKDLEDILKTDLNTLKNVDQPMMVNDQLHQLYIEMELEGLSKALTLDEGFTSSSSSGDENPANNTSNKPKKKKRSYSSLMMIYEENAPLPPPGANS